MIWLTVILAAGLAVAWYVKHARLVGLLAFLLGVVISAAPAGHTALSIARGIVQFFGGGA